MMKISLVVTALAVAQYQYPSAPPSQSSGPTVQSFDPGPIVSVYRKCFDQAEKKAKAAASEVKQQEFEACRAAHEPIVEHVAAKLNGADREQARRALDRAFLDVEKKYAKRMGVELTRE